MHNTIINTPGKYYDTKTADWRFNGSRYKLLAAYEHGLSSAAISSKLLQIQHAGTPIYAAFSLRNIVLCQSEFYIFLSLWTGKVKIMEFFGSTMDALSTHVSSRTPAPTVHPAAHRSQTQTMVLVPEAGLKGWQWSLFKRQQAKHATASNMHLWLNTKAGLQ